MDVQRSNLSEPQAVASPAAGAAEAASEHGFLLTVGPIEVRVISHDSPWLLQAGQRYGAFARPLQGGHVSSGLDVQWHLHYEVRRSLGVTPDTITPEAVAPEDLCQARRHGLHAGPDCTWTGRSFEARYQPSIRRVDVVGPAAIYPLDLLLQAMWYFSCPNSLIMHAAALHDGRRGWLCAGPSGSGKSTLVSLCAERAMGDELVALEARGDGFDLVALPFWRAQPGRYPLEAVCCLQHRAAGANLPHFRRRLNTAQALARLRGQVSWPTWDAVAMANGLDVLGRLVESMPVDELAFTPQPDVWQFLALETAVHAERAKP